jgi:hypothetical protein
MSIPVPVSLRAHFVEIDSKHASYYYLYASNSHCLNKFVQTTRKKILHTILTFLIMGPPPNYLITRKLIRHFFRKYLPSEPITRGNET